LKIKFEASVVPEHVLEVCARYLPLELFYQLYIK